MSSEPETIAATALQLLLKTYSQDMKIRLLGIAISNIIDEKGPADNSQLKLF
jgi:hypothetical protein